MLCCAIPEGALFYGETRRRTPVVSSPELRQQVRLCLQTRCTSCYRRGHTPKVKARQVLQCLLSKGAVPAPADPCGSRVSDYLRKAMEELP